MDDQSMAYSPSSFDEPDVLSTSFSFNNDEFEIHRNPPRPSEECLYGLVGDVARIGGTEAETNRYAIAANFMAYLSCAIGRSALIFPLAILGTTHGFSYCILAAPDADAKATPYHWSSASRRSCRKCRRNLRHKFTGAAFPVEKV
jgi:hypothetical protein